MAAVRAKRLRPKATVRPAQVWRGWIHITPGILLTPPRLLELADEFELLALQADSDESRLAFHRLAFRYQALAVGFDIEAISSRRLH